MLKKCFLVLIAASVLSVAASFAGAQDNGNAQAAPPPAEGNGPPNGDWHHHGPPMDPAKRTQELTKKLKLTSDQQTKVQEILQTEHSQMESMHNDTTTPQQDRRAKMMETRKTTDAQVRAILDPGQQKKWDEMQEKREERGERRHHGPPDGGDQSATPPPAPQQ